MNRIDKLAARTGAALLLLFLAVPSTFADWRPAGETWRVAARRVSYEGRVRSIVRDRGGYRVELDRVDYSFYIPNMEVSRAPRRLWVADLRVGAFVRVTGYEGRRGYVDVDGVQWMGGREEGRFERGTLRGTVHRLDLRRDRMTVRDDASGRLIEVDMGRVDRRGRGIDLDDLRRGDRVTLFGDWLRGDFFGAERIEGVHTRH